MADIRFRCRNCDHKLVVEESAAGFEIRCPECGATQTIPIPESTPAPTATDQPVPAVPEFAAREADPSGGEEFKYVAFISYRHTEPDRQWAQWLHTALETYRVPKKLVRERGLPPRLGTIFRDEDELPASADLSREIDRALQQSRFLIVICSPRTPSSEWVNAEVARFRELGRHDQILALLIDGEPRQSFPRALREIRRTVVETTGGGVEQQIEEVEPLAADVRPIRRESKRYVKRMAKLRMLACLLGVPFDDLRRRERERRRRNVTKLVIGAIALALMFGGLAMATLYQRQETEHQRRVAELQKEEVERQRALVRLREQETAQQRKLVELREEQQRLAKLEAETQRKLAEQKAEAARLAEQEAEKQRNLAELSKTAERRATQIAQQERQKAEQTEQVSQLVVGAATHIHQSDQSIQKQMEEDVSGDLSRRRFDRACQLMLLSQYPQALSLFEEDMGFPHETGDEYVDLLPCDYALAFLCAARLGKYDKMVQNYAQMRNRFDAAMQYKLHDLYPLWEEWVRDVRSSLSASRNPRVREVLQKMQEIDRLAKQPGPGSQPNAK